MDLIGGEEVANLTARLRSINATAPIVTSSYAEVDLDNILGVGAFDLSHTMAIDPSWLERNDHAHEPGLESVSLQQAGDLDAGELDRWLTALLEARGDDIYRMKGIVAVAGDDRRHVLQGVHRIFEQRPVDPWGSEARDNRVIFIGRNLDREGLVQGLARCSADRAPAAAATAGTLDQES
jgi:G3E family GTPase